MLNRLSTAVLALLLFAGPAVLGAQAPEGEDEVRANVRVQGTVTDRETGEALEGVSVQLRSESLPHDRDRMTNERGNFVFQPVPRGVYHIRVVRIGYQPIEHTVQLRSDSELRVEVELTSEAVALEPIVVESTRRTSLVRTGFYNRKDRGFGRFVTREDIEDSNAFEVSDLVRRMPGVSVASSNRPGYRGVVTMRGGCQPQVWVDGARTVQPFALDDFLTVHDVEAIEVYNSAEAPPQYSTDGCGAVLVWTRRPGADNGEPFTWRRLFVAVGFLGAGFLLTR